MAKKKLNPIKTDSSDQNISDGEPMGGTVYDFQYEKDDWVKVARLEWNGDLWVAKGDAPDWLNDYLLDGRQMGDRTIHVTDRDFYKVFAGLTYQMFVPDDEENTGEDNQ